MKCFSFCIKCLLWKLKRCLRLASKETRGKRSQSPAFPSLLYHRAQNLAVSSHNDLQWKRCCFSHCGQGEGYCFSGGQACVYRTKEVHHPASLSPALFFLCLSLYLSSVCGPQGSLQLERLVGLEWMRGWSVWRRLLWSEVHHWPIPPPASTLAARCSPGKGPYPLLPIPSCLWRNAPGPRTLKMRPLFLFCLFFFFIFSFIALNIPDDFSVCWFLFMALGSAQYLLTMPLGHPASHLIWSSGLGHLGVKTTPKQKH